MLVLIRTNEYNDIVTKLHIRDLVHKENNMKIKRKLVTKEWAEKRKSMRM